MYKTVLFAGMFFLLTGIAVAQPVGKPSVPEQQQTFCLSQEEMILYNLVNDLRKQNKLSIIPLSKSLSIVSRVHIDDLLTSRPQDKGCSYSSWSSNGNWTACCSGKDPVGTKCMNSKPSEIAGYPGIGFELVYWEEDTATPMEAFDLWKQVDASREMLLGSGKWKSRNWKAMGVGIRNGFAVIWLGDKPDTPANISICGSDTLVQTAAPDLKKSGNKSPVIVANKPEPAQAKPEKVKEPVRTPVNNNHYFIVVASLKTKDLALERIEELKNGGYSDAMLVPSPDKFRISLGSYPTESKAKERMKTLRENFPDCWMLKQ